MYYTYAEIKAAGHLDKQPTLVFIVAVNVVAAALYFLFA